MIIREKLIMRLMRRVESVANRFKSDEDLYEEIRFRCIEAIIQAVDSWNEVSSVPLEAWGHRHILFAVSKAYDKWKRRQKYEEVNFDDQQVIGSPEEEYLKYELIQQAEQQCNDELDLMILYDILIEKRAVERELAEDFNISQPAVAKRKRRLRERIKEALDDSIWDYN